MEEQANGSTAPESAPTGPDRDRSGLPEVRAVLEDLDLEGGPFCTSAGPAPEALVASIQRVGVLNPPLVHRDPDGRLDVVTGFRRLRALRDLGRAVCLCRDLSGRLDDPLELLLLGIHDNLATRPWSDGDKALAVIRLAAHEDREALLFDHMPLLGLGRREELLEACLFLEDAEPPVWEALAGGRLSLASVPMLQSWSSKNRLTAVHWIQKLNFNMNKQLQFIDFLHDLSEIEGCSVAEILTSVPARTLLEEAGTNAPQAAARLLEHLRRRRLPTVAAAESAFRRTLSSLALPSGVRVHPPPGFEGRAFHLEIAFRNGRELRERLEGLASLSGLEALGPPWEAGS